MVPVQPYPLRRFALADPAAPPLSRRPRSTSSRCAPSWRRSSSAFPARTSCRTRRSQSPSSTPPSPRRPTAPSLARSRTSTRPRCRARSSRPSSRASRTHAGRGGASWSRSGPSAGTSTARTRSRASASAASGSGGRSRPRASSGEARLFCSVGLDQALTTARALSFCPQRPHLQLHPRPIRPDAPRGAPDACTEAGGRRLEPDRPRDVVRRGRVLQQHDVLVRLQGRCVVLLPSPSSSPQLILVPCALPPRPDIGRRGQRRPRDATLAPGRLRRAQPGLPGGQDPRPAVDRGGDAGGAGQAARGRAAARARDGQPAPGRGRDGRRRARGALAGRVSMRSFPTRARLRVWARKTLSDRAPSACKILPPSGPQ